MASERLKMLRTANLKPPHLMTDYETHQFLKKLKSTQKRNTPTPLATITYEIIRYLDAAPCAKRTGAQLDEAIAKLSALTPKLSGSIILQILNNPPMTALEFQTMVGPKIYELADSEVNNIIKICNELFKDIEENPPHNCAAKEKYVNHL